MPMNDPRRKTSDYHPNLVFKDREGYWWAMDADRFRMIGPCDNEIAAEELLYRTLFHAPSWPK